MLLKVTEQILGGLGDRVRQIFELTLPGVDTQQVSGKLGCFERTVERVLQRIREGLEDR